MDRRLRLVLPKVGNSVPVQALIYPAILFVLATMWIWALANAVLVTLDWEFDDVHAYVTAAQRLVDSGPLYITADDTSDLYLYAPWFAFAWIPISFLPAPVIEVGWAIVLLAAFFACLWPFRRSWAGMALALLLGGLLYRTVGWGNVQPLLLAALIYLLPTRAGPVVTGVAASLKPWPILVVAIYAWRRQWSAAAVSVGVAALLWLPALLFNWTEYPAGDRPPNIYDATFLLAVPSLLRRRPGDATPGPRAAGRSGSPGAGAG
jgi:hypothetical protein